MPIIPTFLYAMEHPSPEPQTAQPSLLPLPSLGAPVLDTQSSPPPSPPLVSLFDGATFRLQEDSEPTEQSVLTTDLQTNQTSDSTVGGG